MLSIQVSCFELSEEEMDHLSKTGLNKPLSEMHKSATHQFKVEGPPAECNK